MAMPTLHRSHARALILFLKNAGRRRAEPWPVEGANDFDVIPFCSHSLVLDSTIRLSRMRQMTRCEVTFVTSTCQKHAQQSAKRFDFFNKLYPLYPGREHKAENSRYLGRTF